jgi:8-oxo-dGTP diphosphatase
VRRHSVSAGAVVVRADGRFLAVHRRDTGAWVTPGGIVEPGEPIRETAAREVYEESGVKVRVGELSGIYQNLSTDVVSFVFIATPEEHVVTRATEEADRVRWFTPIEAEDRMTEAFATRVRDAYAKTQVAVRTVAEPDIMAPRQADQS